MPQNRKRNEWACSAFETPHFDKNVKEQQTLMAKYDQDNPDLKKMRERFNEVSEKSWKPVFEMFDGIKMPMQVIAKFNQNRLLAWNFNNITCGCNTVEFRQPPGVEESADALHWVIFTLGFIRAALDFDSKETSQSHAFPNMAALSSFIARGIKLAQVQVPDNFTFTDRFRLDTNKSNVLTAKEITLMKSKEWEVLNKMECPHVFHVRIMHRQQMATNR